MFDPDTLVPAAALGLAVLMAAAWLRQRRTGDAGLVDVVWSGSFGLLAIAYAAALAAPLERKLLIAAPIVVWSWRLAFHIHRRAARSGVEDGRYRALREEKGDGFQAWIFWFFQAQGVSVVLLSLPALLALANEAPAPNATDLLGAALLLTSIVGESIADRQLDRFRADPTNRGRVCRDGLWRYSRHPNYFFEWLHWLAYPVWTWGLPYGTLTWAAPAVMLLLMLKVTGIPPTEEQALKSRGDAYRDYQRTTSAFFPWFPTESKA